MRSSVKDQRPDWGFTVRISCTSTASSAINIWPFYLDKNAFRAWMPLELTRHAEIGDLPAQRQLIQFTTYLPDLLRVLEQANHPLLLRASLTLITHCCWRWPCMGNNMDTLKMAVDILSAIAKNSLHSSIYHWTSVWYKNLKLKTLLMPMLKFLLTYIALLDFIVNSYRSGLTYNHTIRCHGSGVVLFV